MKPEDIKVGETYYARVKVDSMDVDGAYFQLIDENGHGDKGHRFYSCCYYAFLPTPTPPKYDPCRRFKEGDKVRLVDYKGRSGSNEIPAGTLCTVSCNENECEWVVLKVKEEGKTVWYDIDPAYIELVTSVEELEQLYINPIYDCDNGNQIGYEIAHADGLTEAIFYGGENNKRTLEEALTAAEAERDRLNAEYRKEQNNG